MYNQDTEQMIRTAEEELRELFTEIDRNAYTYETFVGAPTGWKNAKPYDEALEKYYKVDGESKYNLQTVKQLGADVSEEDLVATHYGDWPAPEIFVIN